MTPEYLQQRLQLARGETISNSMPWATLTAEPLRPFHTGVPTPRDFTNSFSSLKLTFLFMARSRYFCYLRQRLDTVQWLTALWCATCPIVRLLDTSYTSEAELNDSPKDRPGKTILGWKSDNINTEESAPWHSWVGSSD